MPHPTDQELLEELYSEALAFATEHEALNHTVDSHSRYCVLRNITQAERAIKHLALELYHNRNS